MGEHNIRRGEKWVNQKRLCELRKQPEQIAWMDTQESIVNDIKEYEDSIKTEDKPKGKPKKSSEEA